jgi:hypothetical protein
VPTGEVRAADITDLTGSHQVVERTQRFFDRSKSVESVELKKVDIVGAEAV